MMRDRKAFTFTEIIVASLILTSLFGAFFAFFTNMRSILIDYQNKTEALVFTENILERLNSIPYYNRALDGAPTPGALHDGSAAGEGWIILPSTVAGEECRLRSVYSGQRFYRVIISADGGYKRINATVTWAYKGKPRSVSLSTIVAK